MNLKFAKEVGYSRYIYRRLLWRINPPSSIRLHSGVYFETPRTKFFAADAYVTQGNVDWNSEYILALFLKSLPTKGHFLDVGAHIGYYSCLLSPYVCKVWAFEPDARNIGYLENALYSLKNHQIVQKAISNIVGEIGFSDNEESSVSHIEPDVKQGNLVTTTTIDQFVQEEKIVPSAIKTDIEGYDILALEGSILTAQKYSPVYLVEYNQEDNRPNTWEGLQEFTDKVGYSIFAVSRQDRSIFGYSYKFSEHLAKDLGYLSTKMIFLVPEIHTAWFQDFASSNGSWSDKSLQPRAILDLLKK